MGDAEEPPGAQGLGDPSPAGLAMEASLIRRALDETARNPGEALRLAAAHRDQFPGGQLTQERRLIEVLARCALGQVAEARRLAAPLRSGGTATRARLARSCAGTSE